MAAARTPVAAPDDLPATQLAVIEAPLRLYRGGVIENPVIAYETWGRLNEARDNTLLLFTGLSPSAHAASSPADPKPGWWESMIGEGKPIDTRRWFVVCVNSLGSPFGSSSPISIDPRTGRAYGLAFPEISVEDIATGGQLVLRPMWKVYYMYRNALVAYRVAAGPWFWPLLPVLAVKWRSHARRYGADGARYRRILRRAFADGLTGQMGRTHGEIVALTNE